MKMPNKTHCKNGHEFTKDTLYVTPKTGAMSCLICRNDYSREYSRKYRALYVSASMYGGNREVVIQRDGEKCVWCGITRQAHKEKYNRDIIVDHIDNNGSSKPSNLKNNNLDNLQTLCLSCNVSKDCQYKKLTDTQVVNIRHIGQSISRKELGLLYKVTERHIGYLLRNESRVITLRGQS